MACLDQPVITPITIIRCVVCGMGLADLLYPKSKPKGALRSLRWSRLAQHCRNFDLPA